MVGTRPGTVGVSRYGVWVHPPDRFLGGARRRVAFGAIALLASAMTMTACTDGGGGGGGPSASPDSPSTSASSSSTGDPVTLRFAVYGGREVVTAYRAMANAYMREKPNVTVKVEATRTAARERHSLDQQFVSKTAPDLFLTDATWMPELVAEGRVQPVDELLDARGVQFGDSFERLGLEAMAANSALQCMPSDVSPTVVFYNKRLLTPNVLLELPGQPDPLTRGWSWSQFVAAAQIMSTPRVKGVFLAPQLTTLTPFIRSAGFDIVDDPRKPTTTTLSNPSSRDAINQVLSLARNRRLSPSRAQLAQQGPVSRFEHGKLAMMLGTRALVPRLRHTKNLSFDVYPLPRIGRFQTIADVSGYCINHDSENVSATADFLAFASSDRGAAIVARSGAVVPANLTTAQSPAFEQTNKYPLNADVFTRVIRRTETMPNPPGWPKVVAATQPVLNQVFYAPLPDLDSRLLRIDKISARLLAQSAASPSASPSQ
jgi:multiple sugar transport system substrate-binding protein